MTDVKFYQTKPRGFDQALVEILRRSVERGWRVAVQCSSAERVEALDAYLWSFDDDGFLPHGPDTESWASEQPVLLTATAANKNGASVRVLVDGAPFPDDADRYDRVVLVFDEEDEDAVAEARRHWTEAKKRGFNVSYWQVSTDGRWVQQAGGAS